MTTGAPPPATTPAAGLVAVPGRPPAPFHAAARVTFPRLLHCEWTKLITLRSTVWTALTTVVVTLGFGLLVAAVTVDTWEGDGGTTEPVLNTHVGLYVAQVAVGVLGVLFISGEYSTGMIRTSLVLAPRRLWMLSAKAAVLGAVTFALGLVTSLLTFLVCQEILDDVGIGASLTDPGVARAVFGAAFFVMSVALLGLGLGTLLRSTGGAIATLLGLLFVAPVVLAFLREPLPDGWMALASLTPDGAAASLMLLDAESDLLSPLAAFLDLLAWNVLALGTGALALVQRDA
ncbi:ABC transporter permease [Frankia sp. CNm7]|uniref:ABC transporter permease n=1 Tax=Frankia nepalensis TaxID=1836974 RepID=A0A937RFD5_9ACTN|nr:ABC transporter permease [Frankia nepalensis]MBL7500253.1 ABC transporter permease [Frankia nepalensis]MBL7513529.1 ABC transporter permease [Frankia nepalensis]MBL7522414.1 ABC transporter permease [Frankia nepalensis]MBL7628992.1 ABC transporter permease [Frankia nepalensis]